MSQVERHLETLDGWCDISATIHDETHTTKPVRLVKCIQPDGHDGAHTWTTYRPESTWINDGELIRLDT